MRGARVAAGGHGAALVAAEAAGDFVGVSGVEASDWSD